MGGPWVSFVTAQGSRKAIVKGQRRIIPSPYNLLFEKIMKVLVVIFATHLSADFPWAHLTLLLLISVVLTGLTLAHPSCNYRHVMHQMRLLMSISTVAINVISMISKSINDKENWWPARHHAVVFVHVVLFAVFRQQQACERRAQGRRDANELWNTKQKAIATLQNHWRSKGIRERGARKARDEVCARMFKRYLWRYEGVFHFKRKVARGRIAFSELLYYMPSMALLMAVALCARAPPSQSAYLLADASRALVMEPDCRLAEASSPRSRCT
jgi:hypothetical protein